MAQQGAGQVGAGRVWDIYRRANPRWEALFNRASQSIAGRVTHDTRDHHRLQGIANPEVYHVLRCALILNGVDICPLHGWRSAVHSDEERPVPAFEKALLLLGEDGCFS